MTLTPSQIAQFFASCPNDSVVEILFESPTDNRKRLEIKLLEYSPPGRHVKPIIFMTLGERK